MLARRIDTYKDKWPNFQIRITKYRKENISIERENIIDGMKLDRMSNIHLFKEIIQISKSIPLVLVLPRVMDIKEYLIPLLLSMEISQKPAIVRVLGNELLFSTFALTNIDFWAVRNVLDEYPLPNQPFKT